MAQSGTDTCFYDVSWLVSGMVVREWDSFCPCALPPPPASASTSPSASVWSSIMAPSVESFESLMPGLRPNDNLPSSTCKSFALRSSHFRNPCPVPSLWLEEQHPPHILQWLGSSDCSISRLIVAGPHSPQSTSSMLTTLHKSWPNSQIRHLVLYNIFLDADHWQQLIDMLTSSKCRLQSLALLHLQPPNIDALVPSIVQILQDSASKISELIIHGAPNGIGHKKSFKRLLRVLRNQTSSLRRLSLTSCRLEDGAIEDISALLKSADCKLTALNLSANFFTEIGLHHLQEALMENLSSYNEFPLEMLSLCGSPLYLRDKEVTKAVAKIMESPGSSLKTLDLSGRSADPEWISNLSQILKKGSCKIKSVYQFHASYVSSDRAPSHEKLITALKSNRHITELQFPWATEAYQQIAHTLLERNARLERTGLVNEPMVRPRCVKLFLCGHEGAGKSTLRKNLLKPEALQRVIRKVASKRRVTQGMKLCILPLPDFDCSLVICDLAGQREYHALHHFFMTSSNEGLFAVICKYEEVDGCQLDRSGFRMRLEYWLKFIVSHRTRGHPAKPRVVLVVNFFDCGKKGAEKLQQAIANTITAEMVKKYCDLLDFEFNGASNVFGVKLNSILSDLCGTLPIKSRVVDLTAALIRDISPVFEICEDMASVIREKRKQFPLVMSMGKLLEAYSVACSQARQGESGRRYTAPSSDAAFEAALLELHKVGQVVFFKSGAEGTMMHDQLVLLNPMWFYETLVGAFMKPMMRREASHSSHGQEAHGVWREEDIRLEIINRTGVCDKILVGKILMYLEKLELFFVLEEDQAGRQLLFPSVLPDQAEIHLHAWHLRRNSSNFSFFGRRLECEDSERSLLPWGVFTRLQVQLHAVYGRNKQYGYRVGYGWITFTKDDVDVLIRFGGAGSHWEDRHWIDIMVRFGSRLANHRTVLELEAEAIICKTKNIVFQICQGLERGCSGITLQEYVILADATTEVLLLSKVEEEVRLEGIQNESRSCAARCGSDSVRCKLLLPAELKELSLRNVVTIKELMEDFALKGEAQSQVVLPDQLASIERRLYELFKDNMRVEVAGLMSHVVKEFEDVRASLYASLSEQVLRMQVAGPHALPVCPYLVDNKGKWQKLMRLKKARLHLMCESFEGCHRVEHQKGVVVTLSSPEWLAKLAPVLIPGLKLAFGAAKIGAAFFLPGSDAFMPGASTLLSALGLPEKVCIQRHNEAFPQLLTSFVEGVPNVPHNLACLQASPLTDLLQEFYKFALEGHEREVDMEQDFSLHYVYFPQKDRSSWVCRLHHGGGQIVQASANPFQFI